MALGAVGALAVQAWSAQDPARHWIERDGTDWGRLGHEAQTAYVEGFLAGAALGQAAEQACSQQELRAQRQGCEWTGRSAGLAGRWGSPPPRRIGIPCGANVYASRISDPRAGR